MGAPMVHEGCLLVFVSGCPGARGLFVGASRTGCIQGEVGLTPGSTPSSGPQEANNWSDNRLGRYASLTQDMAYQDVKWRGGVNGPRTVRHSSGLSGREVG